MEERICINGIEYERVKPVGELPYVIARTYSAGVFAGYLKERNGKEGTLLNARRIWYWDGAASLSQLAMEGTSKPTNCKFPIAVEQVVLTEIVEVLTVTRAGKKSIEEVPVWKK
ncbi:hypothetical protein Metho_1195 [Methanomethylovorans hollandica DSM 15978]|uniref:DUF6948 domain-containing protein n=1 Tax=Methanomethylovorans hollandica (strain DSM 15978 / NBRC 107637 / DMS1) TaxID=867904 RepID=L0KXK7_METHD|nr:hypothetical protein [Methanomethylovorans hollandica]AGB49425.1 hypothetical protein Metho_1195 [Methanomethylovorans hollandica DSM 15978]